LEKNLDAENIPAVGFTRPPLVHLSSGMSVINEVQRIRREGLQTYFTINARSQVKVISLEDYSWSIADRLLALCRVHDVVKTSPVPAVRLVEVFS
jgi:mevalonate pyrophosphate decarboxylase